MTSARPWWLRTSALCALVLSCTAIASAQTADSLTQKPVIPRTDTSAKIARPKLTRIASPSTPPLSPKQAFMYSLLVPGLGQSKLDRGSAGAFFAAIELGAIAMIRRSETDLREVRHYSGDSLPANYTPQTDGTAIGIGSFPNRLPRALVNTRRLHVEDWIAALAFNHLFSAADSFVAAQLWDVSRTVSVLPTSDGVAVVATLHW